MKILVLTGSARPNSAGKNIARLIKVEAEKFKSVELDIADVADLKLPFLDSLTSPAADDHVITNSEVQAWSDRVRAAEAVIWLMPEYNHSISGIQKNAIDWLYYEWANKPLGIIAYGWRAGAGALESIKLVLKVVKADLRAEVGLSFKGELNPDGTASDPSAVSEKISDTLRHLALEMGDGPK